MIDRLRFPTTAAYLDAMPLGIDSFPDYVAKASLYRMALDALPLRDVRGALPDALVDLIEHPKPVSDWVPEACMRAILHALYDDHFRDRPAYLKWVYEQNRALFASPLYRILMTTVVSPEMLLRGAEARWGAFHRGISVKPLGMENGAELVMQFPIGLVGELDLLGHAESFRAGIDAAGARDGQVLVVERKPSEARLRATWT